MKFHGWLAVAFAALAIGCSPKAEEKVAQAAAAGAAGYADPRVCAGCHAGIDKSYRLTGMGRSIRPLPDPLVEDVTRRNKLIHQPSGNTYTMTTRDGAIVQRRHQIGFGGQEASIDERRADFVIGSGNHARSYLARNREGKFVELPVTWYSEKGGYWEMSPGYDRVDQEDFRRVVPEECLFCHSSYAEPLQAIDCQRCHGPGRAHAESAGRAPILNPKRLSRERQLEICMQCHLETTSSPLPNAIRHFDRGVFSYRPGEPLGEYSLYFDHAPGTGHDGKFEIAHAAYRLRKSACFQKSQMTCGSCHDPHQVQRGAKAAGCKQCHASAHNPGSTCIECHMPKRRTEDAVHVVMTDHFIQRRALEDRRPKQSPYRREVSLYYPERLTPTPENEAYLATAQVQHGANLEAGIPRLEAAVTALSPAGPEFYFELGKAYSKKGDEASAVHWHEEALRRQSNFRPAIKGLAASLLAVRNFGRAAGVLAGAKDPDARMLANLGQALIESGKVDEAARALDRAVAANPDLPEPHDLNGLVWLRRGDAARAEAGFREALRIQPDLATAHANLASLLAGRKDFVQSRFHFMKALSIMPSSAGTHLNYAYVLILMRNYGQARAEFEIAARLDPSRPEIRLELAELELAEGRPERAAEQYRMALQRAPGLFEAHYGLGTLLWKSGKAAEARVHLQKASQSGNPAQREEALRALASIR